MNADELRQRVAEIAVWRRGSERAAHKPLTLLLALARYSRGEAHIKWHQAGGPDVEVNGLALCVLHHKLFDRGAYSLSPGRVVQVSEQAHGSTGFGEWLLAFHNQPLREPQRPDYEPNEDYIDWHRREVFRGPARHMTQ